MKALVSYHIDSSFPLPFPWPEGRAVQYRQGRTGLRWRLAFPGILPSLLPSRLSPHPCLAFGFFFWCAVLQLALQLSRTPLSFPQILEKKKKQESWSADKATCKCEEEEKEEKDEEEDERPRRVLKCCDILKSFIAEHKSRSPL